MRTLATLPLHLALLLPLYGATAPVAATKSAVTLELVTPSSSSGAMPSGQVVARPSGESGEVQSFQIGSEPMVLRGEAGTLWQIELAALGWWMDPLTVTMPQSDATIALRIFRTATFAGKLSGERRAKVPRSLKLIVESPPWSAYAVRNGVELQCPIAEDGTWSCTVPATKLGFAIVADGFVPEYRWDVQLEPGSVVDAGRIALTEGGSVAAWIAPDQQGNRAAGVRGIVRRRTPPVPSAATQRLAMPVAEASAAANGFLQLAPLPAGTYALELQADGFAATRIFPIDVIENRETTLRRAVELHKPVKVSVVIEPAVDPTGAAWRAAVHHGSSFGSAFDPQPVFNGPVDASGAIELSHQSPGRFRVRISDREGNRIAEDELEVPAEGTAPLRLKIPVVHVRGIVTERDAPLAASLWFGGERGAPRVQLSSDESGNFTGWLPRDGRWLVDVRSRDGRISTAATVIAQDGKELQIAVPATRVTGRVLLGDRPAAQASVVMFGADGLSLRTLTGGDGGFAFQGALPGSYTLVASSRTGQSSAPLPATLEGEESEIADLRLNLTAPTVVTGRVVRDGRPIVAAQVHVSGGGAGLGAITDVDGSFSARMPGHAGRVSLVVKAPGLPLEVFERNVSDDIVLELGAQAGALQLDLADRTDDLQLTRDGMRLPVSSLLSWAHSQGIAVRQHSSITIPNVAVGNYRLCRASRDATTEQCAAGTLLPGATLNLNLGR